MADWPGVTRDSLLVGHPPLTSFWGNHLLASQRPLSPSLSLPRTSWPGRFRLAPHALGLVVLGFGGLLATPLQAAGALQIGPATSNPSGSVGRFEKLEITFEITGSTATSLQWPYDASPPNGVPPGTGISVEAVFTDPDGRQYSQPAFIAEQFVDEMRDGRNWHLPTGILRWKVRFAPNRVGTWSYKLAATDRNGRVETASSSFSVTTSTRRGFVKVSARDPRYFEFDDGTLFAGLGTQLPSYLDAPSTIGAQEYAALAANGMNFARVWISHIFGAAWHPWIGGRNQYGGYMPITGLTPFTDVTTGETRLAMRLDYEPEGDTGWFDACRMRLWTPDEAEAVRPNTRYRIRIEYHGEGIAGPRVPGYPNFGLVAKIGGWYPDCYQPTSGTAITSYGGNNNGFGYVEGYWNSGTNNFMPRMYLGLENVNVGAVWVRSVSVREDLGGGAFGPEMMVVPSSEREKYVPEERAYAFDKVVDIAEKNGVYLKLVVLEKDDKMYKKLDDSGNWSQVDNLDGFYGIGRTVNKTRWLQQAWWRYLQARWGYSTAIHSWELMNEGDPGLFKHYDLADEFGKYMRCRAFGIDPGAGDGARCQLGHPNAHLVTTSFWTGFPSGNLLVSPNYPNIDYGDIHAYVSTSHAPLADRQAMQWDAAYFHTWHSLDLAGLRIGKPVVRGEAGLDAPDNQNESVLGLNRDTTGVWLHNFLWSALDSGGLYELYWWTSHIWTSSFDHRPVYRGVRAFVADLPLNQGGYVDWGGTVTNPSLRVVGQKNPNAGSLHLWVQNRQHTWKNVVDGVAMTPLSGDIVVPGFRAGTSYTLERWDTYVVGGRVVSSETIVADASGNITIPIRSLQTDVALRTSSGPRAPTGVSVR